MLSNKYYTNIKQYSVIHSEGFINIVLTILCLFPILPKSLIIYPSGGLDWSWQIAINVAVSNSWSFGKDIVFTYGPLGFLNTGMILNLPLFYLILFHLFLVSCLAFIIYFSLENMKSVRSKIVFLFIMLFTGSFLYIEKPFLLFICFLFFIFYFTKTSRAAGIYIAGIIAMISFFIKLNTGLFLSVLLMVYFVIFTVNNRKKWKFTLLFFTGYVILILLISFIIHVNLPGYILSGLDLINYYNDSMVIIYPFNILLYCLIILFVFIVILGSNIKTILFNKNYFVLFLFTGIAIFILFKQSFVRADGHMLLFFWYITSLMGLLYIFIDHVKLKKDIFIGIVITGFLCVVGMQVYYPTHDPVQNIMNINLTELPYGDIMKSEYKSRLEQSLILGKQNAMIPDKLLNRIGNNSVDIVPWEISYLYFNKLNYNPRPVIQSYSAYSEKLDGLNSEKYASINAPEYILYSGCTIDNRHPFWDESSTKLTMLTHYEIVDSAKIAPPAGYSWVNSDFFLMKKREKMLTHSVVKRSTIPYKLGDTLKIPKTENLIYLFADIHYSLLGKIRRFFFQPPLISAMIIYEGTDDRSNNLAIIPILKGGVLLNKRVLTTSDIDSFFKTSGSGNINASKICFYPNSIWLNNEIQITLHEIKIIHPNPE